MVSIFTERLFVVLKHSFSGMLRTTARIIIYVVCCVGRYKLKYEFDIDIDIESEV